MSYSIEHKTAEIKIISNPPSGIKKYPYELFRALDKFKGAYENFKADSKKGIDLSFNIERKSGTEMVRIDYKKIKSGGPIVNFMGLYLDISSGYVLLDTEKSREYIPLANYYSWLENYFNVSISPNAMSGIIEKFKVGDIGEEGFENEFDKAHSFQDDGSKRSVISNLLSANYEGNTNRFIFPDIVYYFFSRIMTFMRKIKLLYSTNLIKSFNAYVAIKGQNHPELIEFLRSFEKNMVLSDVVTSILHKENLLADDDEREWMFRSLCTGLDSGMSHNLHMTYGSEYLDMTKQDIIALNLRDIIEERRDDTIVDFDNMALTSRAVSKEEVTAIIDKVGAREYMDNMFEKDKELIAGLHLNLHIAKMTSTFDLEEVGAEWTGSGEIPIQDLVGKFRRMSRVFKSSIKMIDTIMR